MSGLFPLIAAFVCLLCACGDAAQREDSAEDAPAIAEQQKAKENLSPINPAMEEKTGEGEQEAERDAMRLSPLPDGEKADRDEDVATEPAARAAPTPPLTTEEAERADKILAFANQAIPSLNTGYFALPAKLRENSRRYLETWRLPKRPKIPSKSFFTQKLVHPRGIFTEEEEKQLTAGLAEMNRALENMLGIYRDLEKYVADDSIRDDGKLGRELTARLEEGHGQFLGARKSWLEIVENNAARAGQALLRNHPLQRQILAASQFFGQMREVNSLLKLEKPEPDMLLALKDSMSAIIAKAGKPPFDASPRLERLYREFLRCANIYGKSLDMALKEGLFRAQRREIARAAKKCQTAYNNFAASANKLSNLH